MNAAKIMNSVTYLDKIRNVLFSGLALLIVVTASGQSLQEENEKLNRQTNKLLREAEDRLAEDDFSSAEASYREAVSKDPDNVKAKYNMANMYYGKERPGNAAKRLKQAASVAETKEDKHKIFHNLGNSYMDLEDYRQAVEAYKNALRNNPTDEETRYNLALAKKMLEEEEQEGGGGDDNQENQDQNQDNQDQNEGDQGDQEQENQEGEDQEDENGDNQDDSQQQPEEQDENGNPENPEQGEEEQQPQQPQPGQLSPEQIQSLLEAMNNEEKKVQDKINAEKAKGAKTRTEKDW